MSIGAIGGVGGYSNDYSWYTPGSAGKVQDSDSFDITLDAYDVADNISDSADELADIANIMSFDVQNTEKPIITPIDEASHFSSDRMGQGYSSAKVSMEDLYMSSIGFHTKHKINLLGL